MNPLPQPAFHSVPSPFPNHFCFPTSHVDFVLPVGMGVEPSAGLVSRLSEHIPEDNWPLLPSNYQLPVAPQLWTFGLVNHSRHYFPLGEQASASSRKLLIILITFMPSLYQWVNLVKPAILVAHKVHN